MIFRIVSVRIHDYQNFSCLETTAELKGKPLDYFNYLYELIIVKKLKTLSD